jgi:hypothetical protein
MEIKEIKRIKEIGIERQLLEEINNRTWKAKMEVENITHERCKDFNKHITEARKLLDEAERLYLELHITPLTAESEADDGCK